MADSTTNPDNISVAEAEILKQAQHQIRMDLEFCLSEGYKDDENLKKIYDESESHVFPIDALLHYDRLKKLNVNREQLMKAIAASEVIEVTGDATGIKRRSPIEPDSDEPEPAKKLKTEGDASRPENQELKKIDLNIYKITFTNPEKKLENKAVQQELIKAFNIDINYVRLHGDSGYFAIDSSLLQEEDKNKLVHAELEIDGITAKIQACANEDIENFYQKHGGNLNASLRRSGHKISTGDSKDEINLVFYNKSYMSPKPLEYIFQSILSKNKDDEAINPADHVLLGELITYHDNYDDLVKDLDHFTIGKNPKDEVAKCFFAVDKSGNKKPFSFDECYEHLLDRYSDVKAEH